MGRISLLSIAAVLVLFTISAPEASSVSGYWTMDDNAANATVVDSIGGYDGTFGMQLAILIQVATIALISRLVLVLCNLTEWMTIFHYQANLRFRQVMPLPS